MHHDITPGPVTGGKGTLTTRESTGMTIERRDNKLRPSPVNSHALAPRHAAQHADGLSGVPFSHDEHQVRPFPGHSLANLITPARRTALQLKR